VAITTYTSLGSAVADWLARAGDADLATRFPDFLALHEERMYYGAQALPTLGIAEMEGIRIPEMETVAATFALSEGVAQPAGFLELIQATLNVNNSPIDIVDQSILDGYGQNAVGGPYLMAVSGSNFRFKDDPGTGTYTAVLRYYAKLTSPSPTNDTNWILTNAPSIYLNGCLLEAAKYIADSEAAKLYAALYASGVAGQNRRKNRVLASAQNLRMRLRGRTP
jgi:hypothetical protein